jgi:hypothetical protein
LQLGHRAAGWKASQATINANFERLKGITSEQLESELARIDNELADLGLRATLKKLTFTPVKWISSLALQNSSQSLPWADDSCDGFSQLSLPVRRALWS